MSASARRHTDAELLRYAAQVSSEHGEPFSASSMAPKTDLSTDDLADQLLALSLDYETPASRRGKRDSYLPLRSVRVAGERGWFLAPPDEIERTDRLTGVRQAAILHKGDDLRVGSLNTQSLHGNRAWEPDRGDRRATELLAEHAPEWWREAADE
ncbi:hypothetical protein [Halalkalicoccus jeotgali]|uniref:Uncharacterized protein n=1 Tax=Halalkalicoccus jeotgali (strain DSM 18796 / CECT 7217 / JCM 14584 / KCTC 4019 / B3) TaxID=795797 RepID=L9V689_HALJB|nr:hypothetical protein [Halalkalicoccus jeotgali]ELY32574.1 hypothetical protein C497_19384 [Halalkalicoccus jeotgali B3]